MTASEPSRQILFVTGRLAAPALEQMLPGLAERFQFSYHIQVMPITVAALMTPAWIARRLEVPPGSTEVIVPGYCRGDLTELQSRAGCPVERGPRDLYQLDEWFGGAATSRAGYGPYALEIIAEINHAPDRTLAEIANIASELRASGADVIDLGCNPGQLWHELADAVRLLRDAGHRVSIDTFSLEEAAAGVAAGAELVLSVNSTNREAALDWDCELVVIPDDPQTLSELDATIELLQRAGKRFRIDPILAPIGCGFAESLVRYAEVRRRYPEQPMMMGVGNVTELTDCDSAGLNVLLSAFCEEFQIRSVLTTQVIPWAQSSVRELDVARRLAHFAIQEQTIPKRVDPRLVMLRDPRVSSPTTDDLNRLAQQLKDPNYRLFVADGELHLLAAGIYLRHGDPFELYRQLAARQPTNLDSSHAFYLGYELAKAKTALTLGKQYRQDEALRWGLLTVEEPVDWHARRIAAEPTGDGPTAGPRE